MSSNEHLISAIQQCDHGGLRDLVVAMDWDDPELDEFLPLHYAAQIADLEVLRILLSTKCSRFLNTFSDISYTPLMYAAKRGDTKMVAFLIETGADVNANDEAQIGNTVLREVIEEADRGVVDQLLAAGANPTIKGWMQLSAVDMAMERYETQGGTEAAAILHLVRSHVAK